MLPARAFRRPTSLLLLMAMVIPPANALDAATLKEETRLYWRDRCLISDDGTEPRFFATVLTMIATFAVNKVIDFAKAKADEAAKTKEHKASAKRAIYLFRKGPDGVVPTEAFGCLILVKGKFTDNENNLPFDPSNAFQDTFSLPVRFNDADDNMKGKEWIEKRLKANDIDVEPDLVYEIEVEREKDMRSITFVNRRLWIKGGALGAKPNKKVRYASSLALLVDGAAIVSEAFDLQPKFADYKSGDLLPDWKDTTKAKRSEPKRLAVPSSQADFIASALTQDLERQSLIEDAWAAYEKQPAQMGRRIQALASPSPSVFTRITAEVQVTEYEKGSAFAKQIASFLGENKKALTDAIIGEIPLPSVIEAKQKKAAEAKQKAASALQAACTQWLGALSANSESQYRLQLEQQLKTAKEAGLTIEEVLAEKCRNPPPPPSTGGGNQ